MSRRDDILTAASRCFARRGYAGTTIADIEAEAGYRPRTGGIYRHVGGKEQMLRAVIEREVAAQSAALDGEPAPQGSSPAEMLEAIARRGLAHLDRQIDLMKIVVRDLDQFPELLDHVTRTMFESTYQSMATGFERIPAIDAQATAVLLVSAMVDVKIKEHLLHYRPLGVDDDRLVATWAAMALAHTGTSS